MSDQYLIGIQVQGYDPEATNLVGAIGHVMITLGQVGQDPLVFGFMPEGGKRYPNCCPRTGRPCVSKPTYVCWFT